MQPLYLPPNIEVDIRRHLSTCYLLDRAHRMDPQDRWGGCCRTHQNRRPMYHFVPMSPHHTLSTNATSDNSHRHISQPTPGAHPTLETSEMCQTSSDKSRPNSYRCIPDAHHTHTDYKCHKTGIQHRTRSQPNLDTHSFLNLSPASLETGQELGVQGKQEIVQATISHVPPCGCHNESTDERRLCIYQRSISMAIADTCQIQNNSMCTLETDEEQTVCAGWDMCRPKRPDCPVTLDVDDRRSQAVLETLVRPNSHFSSSGTRHTPHANRRPQPSTRLLPDSQQTRGTADHIGQTDREADYPYRMKSRRRPNSNHSKSDTQQSLYTRPETRHRRSPLAGSFLNSTYEQGTPNNVDLHARLDTHYDKIQETRHNRGNLDLDSKPSNLVRPDSHSARNTNQKSATLHDRDRADTYYRPKHHSVTPKPEYSLQTNRGIKTSHMLNHDTVPDSRRHHTSDDHTSHRRYTHSGSDPNRSFRMQSKADQCQRTAQESDHIRSADPNSKRDIHHRSTTQQEPDSSPNHDKGVPFEPDTHERSDSLETKPNSSTGKSVRHKLLQLVCLQCRGVPHTSPREPQTRSRSSQSKLVRRISSRNSDYWKDRVGEDSEDQDVINRLLEEALEPDAPLPPADVNRQAFISSQGREYDEYGFLKFGHVDDDVVLSKANILQRQSQEIEYRLRDSDQARSAQIRWENFMAGQAGKVLCRSAELKALIRLGVPRQFREKIWKGCIDLYMNTTRHKLGDKYYKDLLERSHNNRSDPSVKQIELDLLRTLPDNRFFEKIDTPGVQKLRRVLLCYSVHNPYIGYCQGLNRIAAIALLFLCEEDAFWCLVAITEHLMPLDYFTHTLAAAQADQRVLKDLVQEKCPKLHAHLELHEVDLSLFTFNWFLTIFVDGVMPELFLRVWDVFLYEGSKVLFRFALSFLKYSEDEILLQANNLAVNRYMRTLGQNITDVQRISNIAFSFLNPFPMRPITGKRQHHLLQVKYELEELETIRKDFKSSHGDDDDDFSDDRLETDDELDDDK